MMRLQIFFHSWLMFYAYCFFRGVTELCLDFLFFFLLFVRTLVLDEELSPLLNLESSSSACWVEMS